MKRKNIHFIVDVLAFIAFTLMTSSGVLLRYMLPPGSGRFSSLWGMNRHDWGDVHYWISIALFLLLTFHLLLNWQWIAGVMRGQKKQGSGYRAALGIVGLIALLLLALAPFFSPIETTDRPGGGHGGGYMQHR
jgi:fucose 4-O-acetylase-like acetyltransferase